MTRSDDRRQLAERLRLASLSSEPSRAAEPFIARASAAGLRVLGRIEQ